MSAPPEPNSPFASPSDPAGPYSAPSYSAPSDGPYGGYPTQPVGWAPPPPRQPSGSTHTIAVIALVLSSLAILGLAVLVFAGFAFAGGGLTGDLGGTAPHVVEGEPYNGSQLADEVRRVIEQDGGTVDSMTCPDTPRVDSAAETTCQGNVDGYDEDVIVDFEDAEGHFTLTED